MPNPRTFFDITVGGEPIGRIVFELVMTQQSALTMFLFLFFGKKNPLKKNNIAGPLD